MLTVIEKVAALQSVDVFTDVPTEQLAYLAAIAEEVDFDEGEVIYKEHDAGDAFYLVLEGEVRLHKGAQEITIAAGGDTFGTWALFDEEPRVVTATPVGKVKLLGIDRERFVDILADHVQISQGILKNLASRLRNLLERVQLSGGGSG
jgi:CRP-like cAMP-binding protein